MKVDWQELTLSQNVGDGYADAARPIESLLRDVVASRKAALPIVVWIYDLEDEKENSRLEAKIFNDLKVGIALKRFVCLKGNIETIPDENLAKQLRRQAPLFYFYDPAGAQFESLCGKQASSRSRFYGAIEKLWSASFEIKLRDFTPRMSKILDGIDRLEKEKELLEAKKARAEGNARKLRAIEADAMELKKEEDAVLAEEQALLAECRLTEQFAPAAKPEGAKNE